MKKVVLLLFLILFIAFIFLKENYLLLSLNSSDTQSANILYNYVLNNLNISEEQANSELNFSKENIFTAKIDLNNDNEKEIIGIINGTFFCGTAGCNLYILQNNKNSFKNISNLISINPHKPIFISNKKTNGYRNIKFYSLNTQKPHIAKFQNLQYVNKEQTEEFERVLKNN